MSTSGTRTTRNSVLSPCSILERTCKQVSAVERINVVLLCALKASCTVLVFTYVSGLSLLTIRLLNSFQATSP